MAASLNVAHPRGQMSAENYLLVEGWTGDEELKLLKAIEEFGYGNWSGISDRIERSPQAAVEVQASNSTSSWLKNVPVAYNPTEMEYPGKEIPHYNPLRGDFEVEPDDAAEADIATIPPWSALESENSPENELIKKLLIVAVQSHWIRLYRRGRVKRIVQMHGLIDIFKQEGREKTLSEREQKVRRCMRPFLRFLSFDEGEKLTQSFILEVELQKKIRQLQGYHRVGITSFPGVRLYRRLKDRREMHKEKRMMVLRDLSRSEEYLLLQTSSQVGEQQTILVKHQPEKKYGTAPLDVSLSPGVDKLDLQERELCSQFRLLPEMYLRCKEAMMTEFARVGKLRLMDARRLCRIDVNKTRKIYNLLVSKGFISS